MPSEPGPSLDDSTGGIGAAVAVDVAASANRLEFWAAFARRHQIATAAEVGVLRGAFAAHLLREAPGIASYAMIDPWRHLDDWNKPANRDDASFDEIYREAMEATAFAGERRHALRGRTVEVADQVADGSLDLAYVDGDHTLRGITVDLVTMYPKVRDGGWIGGDDFSPTIWQHRRDFEPTLVFPFAVHFAEAVGATIYGLPWRQFLIHKTPGRDFRFVDLAGTYADLTLKHQLG